MDYSINDAVSKDERKFKITDGRGHTFIGDKDYILDLMSNALDGLGVPFSPDRLTLSVEEWEGF